MFAKLLVIFGFGYLIFARPAHAYLDPGTGSLLIQILIGSVLGATYFIKLYWKKIKVYLSTHFAKKTSEKK